MQNITNLVWIDLETTGFDHLKEKIIQIAILVTDYELNILDPEGYVAFIKIDKDEIEQLKPDVLEMHQKNGVLDNCLENGLSLNIVEDNSIEYISDFVEQGLSPLCGNSAHFDRAFIDLQMPKLSKYLHHRIIDVTTIKQLVNVWKPDRKYIKGEGSHEALSDIRGSIEELRYYKEFLFD